LEVLEYELTFFRIIVVCEGVEILNQPCESWGIIVWEIDYTGSSLLDENKPLQLMHLYLLWYNAYLESPITGDGQEVGPWTNDGTVQEVFSAAAPDCEVGISTGLQEGSVARY